MATGYYASYSYIEPFLAQVAHVDAGVITMTLTAFGLLWSARKLAVWPPVRWASLPVLGYHALRRAGGSAAYGSGCIVARGSACRLRTVGCCATAFNVAFQAELIKYTQADSSAVAMSIFSGLFNLGIGTGTAIGGAVVSGPGITLIGYAERHDRRRGSHPRHHLCCSRPCAAQSLVA